MTNGEYVESVLPNLAAQWVADGAKKPSLTATAKYNLMVATFNAQAALPIEGAAFTPEDLEPLLSAAFTSIGFPDVAAVEDAHAADWGATWPVAFA